MVAPGVVIPITVVTRIMEDTPIMVAIPGMEDTHGMAATRIMEVFPIIQDCHISGKLHREKFFP